MRFDGFVFGGDEKFITMIVMRFIVLSFSSTRTVWARRGLRADWLSAGA
jgi:hypothetical protein